MSKKAKKNRVVKPIPFPKELYVQNAQEEGSASENDGNWTISNEDMASVTHGVRCAVYVLKEVIIIDKHETYTTTKAK